MKNFNLQKALQQWARRLRKHAGFEDADVLEATNHIQDRVHHLLIEGMKEEEAFQRAIGEFGGIEEVGQALSRTRQPSGIVTQLFLLLPGWAKSLYRTSVKQKVYHSISLFSLGASLATVLVIYKLLSFELSFDRHFTQHQQIYRLEASFYQGGEWISSANNSWFAGQVIRENLSGIEEIVRITPGRTTFVLAGEEVFEPNLLVGSSSFFELFDLTFLEGNAQSAFQEKKAIVLSESMAKRYFGAAPALGQSLKLKNAERSLTVTGVIKDIPQNTHFNGQGIINIEGLRDLYQEAFFTNPGWTSCFTYLKLAKGTDSSALTDQFPKLITSQLGSTFSNTDTKFLLRPLTDIHLHSKSGEELAANGNLSQLYFLGAMALLILVLAIFNYSNLTTAGFSSRLKGMAIRRTLGANRLQIFFQFLSESLVHFQLALILGLLIIAVTSPFLESLIPFSVIWSFQLHEVLVLIGLGVFLALLTGILPATILSRITPKNILIKHGIPSGVNPFLRQSLVIFQFMITGGMFMTTAAIYFQYQFLTTYDRGYNVESVLAVPKYNMKIDSYESMKSALLAHNNIQSIGASSLVFPGALQSSINYRSPDNTDEKPSMKAVRTDRGFFDVFNMKFQDGSAFSSPYQKERPEVILNEKAAQLLSWETIENKWFEPLHLEEKAEVVGLAKDINFESLHNDIIPVAYLYDPTNAHIMYLRLGQGAIAPTISFIKEKFQAFSDNRFEHWFVEDRLMEQYTQEQAFAKVFGMFTLVAILIAFAGLYGLSKFICERKTKEIGIRKILGASALQVLWQFLKSFFSLAVLAFLLLAPLASLALKSWLSNFAYHISIDGKIFLLTFIAIIILSTTAVIYQVVKVAIGSPVKALRYE